MEKQICYVSINNIKFITSNFLIIPELPQHLQGPTYIMITHLLIPTLRHYVHSNSMFLHISQIKQYMVK